jgi:hypothetical protein
MNATTTTRISANDVAEYKGQIVTLHVADDVDVTGRLISINSKGWNVQVQTGPDRFATVSRGYGRVTHVTAEVVADDDLMDELDADELEADAANTPDDLASLSDMTTADLAEVFGTSAKALRVVLRKLGMGVGRGQRYHLTADDAAKVKAAIA